MKVRSVRPQLDAIKRKNEMQDGVSSHTKHRLQVQLAAAVCSEASYTLVHVMVSLLASAPMEDLNTDAVNTNK